MPSYILKSLISLRDEITERLMQNSEFRALQSLQRSIDEVTELSQSQERAERLRSVPQARPAPITPSAPEPDSTLADTLMYANARTNVVSRVTPAHFTAAKRII